MHLILTSFKDSGMSRQEAGETALNSAALIPLFRDLYYLLLLQLIDPEGRLCGYQVIVITYYHSSVFSVEEE